MSGVNYTMGNITDSYNNGKVVVLEDNGGGIVGTNNATISNCYNTGEIDSSNSEGLKIGGICGQNASESYIYTSYNIGKMNINDFAGGLVGADFGNISNCFYLDTSIKEKEENSQRKTETEMKTNILTDLGSSFKIDENNINSGYPILSWQ